MEARVAMEAGGAADGVDQSRKRRAPKSWSDRSAAVTAEQKSSRLAVKKINKKAGRCFPSTIYEGDGDVFPAVKNTKVSNAKLQTIDAVEDGLAREALENLQVAAPRRVLPSGPEPVKDLHDAVRKSMQDTTSLLIDWSAPACRLIGHICKVYWDGERMWFDARIVNYDSFYNRFFVYYFSDSTAEWICFEEEAVLVAKKMVLARWGNSSWPALCFTASEKGAEVCKTMKGYNAGSIYIEFLEGEERDFRYVKEKDLDPVQDNFLPKKPSKKFQASLEQAKREMDSIDVVVEALMKLIRSPSTRRPTDEQWVGARVRAPTHRIYSKAERQRFIGDPPTAFCVGTVKHYFPMVRKHFVCFGENLQPLWVHCGADEVELLLERPSQDEESPSGVEQDTKQYSSRVTVAAIDEAQEVDSPHDTERAERAIGQSSLCKPDSSLCVLCEFPCSSQALTYTCSDCHKCFHEYCLPDRKLKWRPLNPAQAPPKLVNSSWKCFHCVACECCGATSWEHQLIYWNVQRADMLAKERWMVLCGVCLHRYKTLREFCTICYRLYSGEESGPEVAETSAVMGITAEPAAPIQDSTVCTEINDKCMVQCNECCRWIHAQCEGLDHAQYAAIESRTHPIWGDEYLCPLCRVQLCREMVQSLRQVDVLQMFAEPVTEDVAKNYFDVIRNPMDLGTMRGKCDRGQYKALQALRHDFELMCMNALLFNKAGDEYWTSALQVFRNGTNLFDGCARKTKITAFGAEAQELVRKHLGDGADGAGTVVKKGGRGRKRKGEAAELDAQDTSTGAGDEPDLSQEAAATADGAELMATEAVSATQATELSGETAPVVEEKASPDDTIDEEEDQVAAMQLVIPMELTPSADPPAYIQPTLFVISADEAYCQIHQDVCYLCGSAGAESCMLFCVDCGEAMHDFCSNTPEEVLKHFQKQSALEYNWRCMNCKICAICDTMDSQDVDNVIFCEACDNAFHMQCLQPAVGPSSSESGWYCPSCVQCTSCSAGPAATPCWGYRRDCCVTCLNAVVAAQQLEHVCGVCLQDCLVTDRYFACEGCSGRTHLECCDLRDFEALYRSGSLRVMCKKCRTQDASLSLPTEDSQLAVDMEDCRRMLLMLEQRSMYRAVEMAEAKINEHCETYSYYALTIVVWATVRLMMLDNSPAQVSSNPKYRVLYARSVEDTYNETVTSPPWQYLRARKFLNYFRRLKKLAPGSPMSSGQLNGLQLLELSPAAISSLSILAASFTVVSDAQRVHTMRSFVESVVVIVEVALIVTRHRNPTVPISLELLNFFYTFFSSSQCFTLARPYAKLPHPNKAAATTEQAAGAIAQKPLVATTSRPESISIPRPISAPGPNAASAADYGKHVLYKFTETEFSLVFDFIHDFLRNLGGLFDEDFLVINEFLRNTVKRSFNAKAASAINPSVIQSVQASSVGAASHTPQVVYLSKLKLLRGMQIARSALLHPPVVRYPTVPVTIYPSDFALLKSSMTESTSAVTSSTFPLTTSSKIVSFQFPVGSLLHSRQHAVVPPPVAEKSKVKSKVKAKPATDGTLSAMSDSPATPDERELLMRVLGTGYGSADMAERVVHLIWTAHRETAMTIARCKQEAGVDAPTEAVADSSVATALPIVLNEAIGHPSAAPGSIDVVGNGPPVSLEAATPTGEEVAAPLTTDADLEQDSLRADESVHSGAVPSVEEAADSVVAMVAPLRGWTSAQQSPGTAWHDTRLCCFCLENCEDALHGRLLPFSDGQYAHANCLLWCPTVRLETHMILHAVEAREECLKLTCHYCHVKGATVRCMHMVANKRTCKRAYHLSCAVAAYCALLETPVEENGDLKKRHCFCPLHALDLLRLSSPQPLQLWSPSDVRKCLLIDDNALSTDSEDLADAVVQRKGDRVLRMGTFSLLQVGTIDAAVGGLFSPQRIYPQHYRAARIFWSMTRPRARTLYVLEVLYEADMANYDLAQLEYVQDSIYAVHSSVAEGGGEDGDADPVVAHPETWLQGPTLRAVAADCAAQPIFAKSADVLRSYIAQAVAERNRVRKVARRPAPSFGLAGNQFFGLGLPVVRRAIELLPGSFDCMVYNASEAREGSPGPEHSAYRPSFVLPTAAQIEALKRQRTTMQQARTNRSLRGCCRADPLKSSSGQRVQSRKLLAKSVDESGDDGAATGGAEDADADVDMGVEIENSRAQEENRRQRYLAMSKAYVLNPNARLEVRRSHIHNWGLFARIGFEKDDIIVEYIGEKIRTVVADKREAQYEQQGVGSCYLFRLDKDEIIDATFVGGMARFMNHCCEPNAYARVIACGAGEPVSSKHIVIIAGRDIREGEEITYDYKFPIEDKKLACYCGAPRCSGAMN